MDIFQLAGTISVKYSDAVDGLEKVSKAADDAAEGLEDVDGAADDAGESVKGAGDSVKDADGKFTVWKATLADLAAKAITSVINKCAELAGSVVDLGTDFTAAMSEVQAISGASDEQMARLEETAREFGSTTVFSATDAAEALKYMSLAGWTVEESTSALGGVLDLAAASGMGLAEASDMVTDYLSAFGMEADQSAYFADMLAYAQANSNTTAEQLGEAYKNCAATMNAAGQDVETTTSLLEALANQGLKGSEAGTAVTAIMRDITNAMEDGAIQIGDTTVAVTDADGNFRDLTDILADVEIATNGMGSAERAAALASVFTTDSTKGLNLILNEGMDAVSGYEEELRNADGTAKDMADTMNDNLGGDIKNAQSAFEELGLKIFDKFEQPMRTAIQFVTNSVVPAFEWMIDNAPVVAAALGTIMAVVVVAKWGSITSSIGGFIGALGSIITAVNPVVLILGTLVTAVIYLWNNNEDFRNAVIAIWEGIKNAFSTAIDAISGFLGGLGETFSNIWNAIKDTTSAVFEAIGAVISGAFFAITSFVSSGLTSISEWFSNAWNAIIDFLSSAWETIKNVVQVGIMFIVELISAAFQLITLPFRFIWENCKEYILAAWESIKQTVSNALHAISSTIANIWSVISSFLSKNLEEIKSRFNAVWNQIKSIIETTVNAIRSVISTAWNAIKTIVSTVVNAIKTTITTVWNAIKTAISTVMNAIKTTVSGIWNSIKSTVTSVVNAIKSTITSVFNAVKSTISSILNSIKSTFSSIWNSIKSTVSNVINGVKSTISSGLQGAFSTVSNVLNNIKNKFSSIFESAKTIVSNAINKIKSFFNFSWSLPKIRMPHFSISGSFSLNPPSVPHFSIEWYKKAMEDGMIMNQPTIFGFNAKTNQLMGGGEAGSETVVGTENLMGMIETAVSKQEGALLEVLKLILQAIYDLDNGIADKLYEAMLGLQFKINEREFARLVKGV